MSKVERELGEAYEMIVMLMSHRPWGAATAALLEDPVVKRAKEWMNKGGEGETK